MMEHQEEPKKKDENFERQKGRLLGSNFYEYALGRFYWTT